MGPIASAAHGHLHRALQYAEQRDAVAAASACFRLKAELHLMDSPLAVELHHLVKAWAWRTDHTTAQQALEELAPQVLEELWAHG